MLTGREKFVIPGSDALSPETSAVPDEKGEVPPES